MNDLNSVLIEGILMNDPETKTLADGAKGCAFTIEVHRLYKKDNDDIVEDVFRFNIEAAGKVAESCAQTIQKGRKIRVVGRLKNRGSETVVLAEHVEPKAPARVNA